MEEGIAPIEAAKMTKVQKLAALLIILGPESAAQMFKGLEERELEAVTFEMSRLAVISQELQHEILREFAEVAVEAGTGVMGGVNYAKAALEKSVGAFRATDIINRVAPELAPSASTLQIAGMNPRELFNLLKQEQPQTIALVASYLSPEKCSQLLMLMRSELRDQVVERLATLAPTPVEVVEKIVSLLGQKAGAKTTRAMNQTGGVKSAADVLNSIEKELSQSLLMELDRRNPELGQAIRQKMFTFEDLALLDSNSLQKIMREVDMRDLAVSLKNASERVKQALLSAISRRAAETVREEISFLGPQKKKEIEAAQLRIIDSVRQLEGQGEIDLSAATGRTRDEILV